MNESRLLPGALLPAEVGTGFLYERAPKSPRGRRSYSHDGRCIECSPAEGLALAVDIEAVDAPAAPYLANRLELDVFAFLFVWTRLEVVAKLRETPALILLKRYFRDRWLEEAGLVIRTDMLDDLVITVGWNRPRGGLHRLSSSTDPPLSSLRRPSYAGRSLRVGRVRRWP